MKVCLLGLDGATWDILDPLMREGRLPNLARLRARGASGTLNSIFPPLSPVAWTGVMTGKNSGKHGVFEFLEYAHNPLSGRVNTSRSIQSELLWQTAAKEGLRTVAAAVPMSYPPRHLPGSFFLGDFLAPPNATDFASDPALLQELENHLGEPYRPWDTSTHDGGQEEKALSNLTDFLDHHLRSVLFLLKARPWDLFVYDLMATDRIQHELWHVWDPSHPAARGRDLTKVRQGFIQFWEKLDEGVGKISNALPADTNLILMSDHGFGPIHWYVNFNVWLLQEGFLKLRGSFYVAQKHWCWKRGVTPQWFYGVLSKLGRASTRVTRFRGKQISWLDRLADGVFLSRKHIDWQNTRAYAQGNFGQIFLNREGRQPQGRVSENEARLLKQQIKERLAQLKDPATGEPLVRHVYEAEELYNGPHSHLAPDLTIVLRDWRYRTIGLYDFTTNKVISPAFGPTGDHRLEGIFVGAGPAFQPASAIPNASLLDIAPTSLYLLGAQVPADMDGRILHEAFRQGFSPAKPPIAPPPRAPESESPAHEEKEEQAYSPEEQALIEQRLADLGYL